MGKVAKAWACVAVTGVGAALVYLVPAVGVAVACLGAVAAALCAMSLNVPPSRVATLAAVALNGVAVFLATGSWLLALSVIPPLLMFVPSELVLRNFRDAFDFVPLLGLLAALVLLGLAWPTLPSPWWALVLVPHALLDGLWAFNLLGNRRFHRGAMSRTAVVVGEPLPVDVVLPARDGQPGFSLKAHLGQFVLLLFVRGDWCPVCHVMMRIVSREAPTLKRHGVKVAVVSPSEGKMEDEAVQRLGLDPGMLYDENCNLSRALGLLDTMKHGGKDVPLPVTILIDKEGIVRNLSRPDDLTAFANEQRVLAILEGLPAAA